MDITVVRAFKLDRINDHLILDEVKKIKHHMYQQRSPNPKYSTPIEQSTSNKCQKTDDSGEEDNDQDHHDDNTNE